MKSHSRSMLITAIVAYAIVTTACAARAQVPTPSTVVATLSLSTMPNQLPRRLRSRTVRSLPSEVLPTSRRLTRATARRSSILPARRSLQVRRRPRGTSPDSGPRRSRDLYPPDGDVTTIGGLVEKLQKFADGPDADRTGWIFGLGYDDARPDAHPTATTSTRSR